jgi:hypothetical protein
MNYKKQLITCMIILYSCFAFAQTQALTGFKTLSSSAISPIFDGKETKGYTLFYKSDKADKGNDNFSLTVYDENLTKTKTINLQKPRGKFFLLGNGYNGTEMGFYFYNYKDKQYELEAYDKSLKKVASRIIKEELTDVEKMSLQQRQEAEEKDQSASGMDLSLYPVTGKGFIRNGILKKGKGFKLEMFDNELKTKWKYETPEKSKEYEGFLSYQVSSKLMLGAIVRRSGMMSSKLTFYLTAFDVDNGNKVFDIPVEAAGTSDQLSLNNMSYDSTTDRIVVIGDYYAEKDKPGVSKSKGFYIKVFTSDGKETTKKFYAWDKEVKELLPSEAKESIQKGAMNFTHKVLKGKDGKFYMICEQFSKTTDGLGIASNILGGGYGSSMTKGVVWNMLVFVLNADLTLTEIKFYPKDKSTVTLPPGADFYGPGMIGLLTKYVGGFDYQFTQMTNDGNSFDVVYIDYDKEKGESTKRILGNIIIDPDGKFNLDKMDITTKATSSFLYPAKPGYLMMVDFLKKEKSIGMKLIKLNY